VTLVDGLELGRSVLVHTPIHVASRWSGKLLRLGKSPRQKASPKERNLVKKYCEVGKITWMENTSPKETNLVKKYCEVGKITSMEKTSPKENNLVKKFECVASLNPVRVGVFVIPTLSLQKELAG
jgi:hypothetical protein